LTGWRVVSFADPVLRAAANAMLDVLEKRFERAQVSDWSGIRGVIVLGGQPDRYREAYRLAAAHPHLAIVISGPSAYELGIVNSTPADIHGRIVFEEKSRFKYRNTYGNAIFCTQLINPPPADRWLLITSAAHMPRAVGTFRKAGFPVEPWPIFDRTDDLTTLLYVVRHEWLGLLGYSLLGRTDQLLPAPSASMPPQDRSRYLRRSFTTDLSLRLAT
jgi:uncharacterized SAM-binding protein YcdF (DUF218 family)